MKLFSIFGFILNILACQAQSNLAQVPPEVPIFTYSDTLRGSITPERTWWDLTFYDLKVAVNPVDSSISGSNIVFYKVLKNNHLFQIDLQPPLSIEKIEQQGQTLAFKKASENAYFVELTAPQKIGATQALTIYFGGKPKAAKNAPWDGGFSWSRHNGKPFIATSCQGLGASVWWPCKDHNYDEPDSMGIAITTPKGLIDVSNGQLRRVIENDNQTTTYQWFVKNPINNYGVNVNIADYAHFSDKYNGEKGSLSLEYYVLPENLEKAKLQFQQVPLMLKAFEYWFGPYPFYEDGYKLVEVPYLGMEHQSSVTYGNNYKNGYLGRDLSNTGWGLKWDFIIVHESGHEWFANNITYKDIADMWIHESFTNYSESLFTEFYYGKEAGAAYVIGTRRLIENDRPIIGIYNVNYEGSDDMYYKGGNMLHTIRQIVNNDEKWRQLLRDINHDFYHQTVETKQIEAYMSQKTGLKLKPIFDQYLRKTDIPILEYRHERGRLFYRWANCIDGFDMPMKVTMPKGNFGFLHPTTTWKSMKYNKKAFENFKIDENFYVLSRHSI